MKTRMLLFALVSSFALLTADAQVICSHDVKLSTQEEVDNFVCQKVTTVLTISGEDITNVDALKNLTSVGALEIVNNPQLTNINGLVGLRTISSTSSSSGSGLLIADNPALKDIEGLSSLVGITMRFGVVRISNNRSLTNLEGLRSLQFCSGINAAIVVADNDNLKNLNGLRSFSNFGWGNVGVLRIENNKVLENVDGLSRFSLGGPPSSLTVLIRDNPSLDRFCGLFPLFNYLGGQITSSVISIENNKAEASIESILASGPCLPIITGFSVINSQTGEKVMDFFDQASLDQANPDFPKWSVQANTLPEVVGSVGLEISKIVKQTENIIPYTLPGTPFRQLPKGQFTLTAHPYTAPWLSGTKGVGLSATISIVNSLEIVSFDLIDDHGNGIRKLNDQDTVYLDQEAGGVRIKATTSPEIVPSVKFFLNGIQHRVENVAPYTLVGDLKGMFYTWNPAPGLYIIEAEARTRADGKGYQSEMRRMELTVLKSQNTVCRISLFPVPATSELNLDLGNGIGPNPVFIVRNDQGQRVDVRATEIEQGKKFRIDVSQLIPGTYYVYVGYGINQQQSIRFIKK